MLSKKRFRVKQVFGIAKGHYVMYHFHYIGLLCYKVKTFVVIIAMNLKRVFNIVNAKKATPLSKPILSTGS